MIPLIQRKRFFDSIRARFGRLGQDQVDGFELFLHFMEEDEQLLDLRRAAYLLATAWHETARRMKPITELGSRRYFDRYDPVLASTRSRRRRAVRMGNRKEGDGYLYRGRGYVQLTWKSNYQRASREIGVDLVANPDLALEPLNAYLLLSRGLQQGWYTGHKLSDYIVGSKCDYFNARRTVNGTDRAKRIAQYAEWFWDALKTSCVHNSHLACKEEAA